MSAQGWFFECGLLLAQRENMGRPVAHRVEARKRPRERGIVPAAGNPRSVMHDAQCAQGLDPAQRSVVEIGKGFVRLDDAAELRLAVAALAGQKHPEILHGRTIHAVVEIHEVR